MFISELCSIFDYFKTGGDATNPFKRKNSLDSKVPCIEVLPKLISISTQFPTFFANKHNCTFRNQHKFDHYWSLHWQILSFRLDQYLFGFLIFEEISEMLKKNRLEKLVSPVKRSAWLYASTLQNFAGHFVDVNEISFVFS